MKTKNQIKNEVQKILDQHNMLGDSPVFTGHVWDDLKVNVIYNDGANIFGKIYNSIEEMKTELW